MHPVLTVSWRCRLRDESNVLVLGCLFLLIAQRNCQKKNSCSMPDTELSASTSFKKSTRASGRTLQQLHRERSICFQVDQVRRWSVNSLSWEKSSQWLMWFHLEEELGLESYWFHVSSWIVFSPVNQPWFSQTTISLVLPSLSQDKAQSLRTGKSKWR